MVINFGWTGQLKKPLIKEERSSSLIEVSFVSHRFITISFWTMGRVGRLVISWWNTFTGRCWGKTRCWVKSKLNGLRITSYFSTIQGDRPVLWKGGGHQWAALGGKWEACLQECAAMERWLNLRLPDVESKLSLGKYPCAVSIGPCASECCLAGGWIVCILDCVQLVGWREFLVLSYSIYTPPEIYQ